VGAAAPTAAAPPRAPGAGETPEEMFTDAKIAAVASVSNFNEIDPSQIALERALTPALKDYARLMIDHHTRLEQSLRAMLGRKGVRPEDNALSLQLKRNGPPTLETLRAKAGRDFDVAYTLQQIQSHQTTLQTLDTSLIPSARDPEMKAMLRDTVRPLVADHLVRILAIHNQVMGAAPAAGQ
jgi:putative membrane protein